MRRVNLDPNAPYVGNRPLKPEGIQLIRRHDQRNPMLDLDAADDEAAELEIARKAQIAEKERSRAEHQAALEEASAPAPKPKPPAKTKPVKAKKPKRN
jgi:hypothetical protein